MLVTPRLYHQYQSTQTGLWQQLNIGAGFPHESGWSYHPPETVRHVRKMLLVHQTGEVKVGEVVRYDDRFEGECTMLIDRKVYANIYAIA